MNKLKLLSTSILCCLSSLSHAEKWAGADAQAKAWENKTPKFKINLEDLYAPDGTSRTAGGVVPYFKPATNPTPERMAGLNKAAEYAAMGFKTLKLPAPRVEVEDNAFQLYFVDTMDAAAAHGGASRWGVSATAQVLGVSPFDEKYYIRIAESEGFDPTDFTIYPQKVGASVAHELFHGVQKQYPAWTVPKNEIPYDGEWFSEGIPDAIGLWAMRGISLFGAAAFNPESQFKSGDCRFAKVMGMRPYDYPLHLSEFPTKAPFTTCMIYKPSGDGFKKLFSYQTSSFWRFIFDDTMPNGQEFSILNDFMNRTPQGKDKGTAALKFADEGLKKYHPAWKRGLYDAYPAFINKWVHFPEDTMKSNQGFFATQKWLEHLFIDGCKTAELGHPFINSVEIKTKIRANAATCIKVKWVDHYNPRPEQVMARLELLHKTNIDALEGIRLGTHGKAYGDLLYEYFIDENGNQRLRTMPARAVGLVPFKPYKTERTGDEIIYTISNMQKDPLKTQDENVILTLSLAEVQAQGSLTHTQYSSDPKDLPPPPSKPKFTGKRVPHNGVAREEDESIQIEIITGAAGDQVATKCNVNQLTSNIESVYEGAGWAEKGSSCAAAVQNRKDIVEVDLAIPYIPLGKTGNISGAEVTVKWHDPHPKLGDLAFSTDQVTLSIEQNTADVVKGKFTANYNQTDSSASTVGTVTGQFAVNLLDDKTRDKAISNDPMDAFPTDWWTAQAFAGHGTPSMNFMQQIQSANAMESVETFGEIQGRKIIYKGKKTGGGGKVMGQQASTSSSCQCDENEFQAFNPNAKAKRQACGLQCLHYPNAMQYVMNYEQKRGQTLEKIQNQCNQCSTSCSDLRAGKISNFCQEAFWNVYQTCSQKAVTYEEAAAMVEKLVKDMPEPMKSEMRKAMLEQFKNGDEEARERWVEMMRQAMNTDD